MWKEAIVAKSRYYPGICLEELWKPTETSVRIVGAVAGIRTEHLPNTSKNRYRVKHNS
jgi:hypothetical protein